MNKEQEIIERLVHFIEKDNVAIGSALPPERKLANMFATSRNTIRNAIRKLEARGLLDIRKGSGSYLLCKEDRFEAWQAIGTHHSAKNLHDLFEARCLFEPTIASLSATKIDDGHIDALEQCLMRFSKSFIGKAHQAVSDEDTEFRKIITQSTGNGVFVSLITQFSSANMAVFCHLDQLDDDIRDQLFADYVEIIKALKSHDPVSVKRRVSQNILNLYRILKQYHSEAMPELDTTGIRLS